MLASAQQSKASRSPRLLLIHPPHTQPPPSHKPQKILPKGEFSSTGDGARQKQTTMHSFANTTAAASLDPVGGAVGEDSAAVSTPINATTATTTTHGATTTTTVTSAASASSAAAAVAAAAAKRTTNTTAFSSSSSSSPLPKLKVACPTAMERYLSQSFRNLLQMGRFDFLTNNDYASEVLPGIIGAGLKCHVYQSVTENLIPQMASLIAVDLLSALQAAAGGREGAALADVFHCVILAGAGPMYMHGREELASILDINKSYILGADSVPLDDFCRNGGVIGLAGTWEQPGVESHLHLDLEDFAGLYDAVKGLVGVELDNSKGTLYILSDICLRVLGFVDRAKSYVNKMQLKDYLCLIQRQVSPKDYFALYQVRAFIEHASCQLVSVKVGIPLGDGVYTVALLRPRSLATTDDGSNLLPGNLPRLSDIIKEANDVERVRREAVIYSCCPWGSSIDKSIPSPPLLEEQLGLLPASSIDKNGVWKWLGWEYIGKSGREAMSANDAAQQRFQEHMKVLKKRKHHSNRFATKALDMKVMGLLHSEKLLEGWEQVKASRKGPFKGGIRHKFEVREVIIQADREERIQFEIRVAGAEGAAIKAVEAEGKLLNTLNVSGVYDAFAASQIGYQAATQQGLDIHNAIDSDKEAWEMMAQWQRRAIMAKGLQILLSRGLTFDEIEKEDELQDLEFLAVEEDDDL